MIQGVLVPFQRDIKSDWANASGSAVVRSDVIQALLMERGELPWDEGRGSRLNWLRHRSLPEATMNDLARVYVVEALRGELANVVVREVTVARFAGPDGDPRSGLRVRVTYDIIDPNSGIAQSPGQEATLVV